MSHSFGFSRTAILAMLMTLAGLAWSQLPKKSVDSPDTDSKSAQLAAENAQYRVSRLPLPGGSTTKLVQHGHDVVIVLLGEGPAELKFPNSTHSVNLKDGDARFLESGVNPGLANDGDVSLQAVVIELKQHWEAEVRSCAEPAKCTRPISAEGSEIGETTSLFTNGFIMGYRHHLVAGATLTSSYFSSKGKDHLLLIPLADLKANFDGTSEELKRGQVYPSEATEIEVTAGEHAVSWIVIRVQTPKT